MKRTLSLLLAITLLLSIGMISSSAESAKIDPSLQELLNDLPDGETVDVAIWATYTMDFKSSLEMREYVELKTREELGMFFQINTVEELDLWLSTYNRILREIETGNRKVIVEKLGLTDEVLDQGCNLLIARLIKEQIFAAAELDEVAYIEPHEKAPTEDPLDVAPTEDAVDEPIGIDVPLVPEPEPEPSQIVGDADGDFEITIMDATRIQRALAELFPIEMLRTVNCDVDKDGEISICDATRIRKKLVDDENAFYQEHGYLIEDP